MKLCCLKIFLFLSLVAILFSGAEWFVQFQRGHYEEHFYEINLNLDHCFRRCRLKIFISSFGGHFVQWSRTVCAILVEGIELHFCEIILNLGPWLRRRCFLKIFLLLALMAILFV